MGWWSDRAVMVAVDGMAIILGQAYQLARARLLECGSAMLDLIVQRDHESTEAALLQRELEVLRGQRAGLTSHRRPDFSPEHRLAILQLMRLRDWSVRQTTERFVLHENTVRSWLQAIEGKRAATTLIGTPRWNRIDDAVRWAVHELRGLFPEPEFGTRTIARHLVRSGIAISRRTVQRVTRENPPNHQRPSRQPLAPAAGAEPDHLLTPATPNRVWHLDLAEHRFLWLRFTLAVLLDSCSRKLLRLTVFAGSSKAADMIDLVHSAASEHGRPDFLITDHGCQFRRPFRQMMTLTRIRHVRGKVRCPSFNGKAERFIRTLRLWLRRSLLPITVAGIQRRLDQFRGWYNTERPHASLNGRTPDDVWADRPLALPIAYRARDDCSPQMTVRRLPFSDDSRLPVVRIAMHRPAA